MADERVAAVVQRVPVSGGNLRQRIEDAYGRHQGGVCGFANGEGAFICAGSLCLSRRVRRRPWRTTRSATPGPAVHERAPAAAQTTDGAACKGGYSPLSRKRSASSAAMQPKPAEVIAWR